MQVPLFVRWSKEHQGIMLLLFRSFRPLYAAPEDIIIEQGSAASEMYVLTSGRVQVTIAARRRHSRYSRYGRHSLYSRPARAACR